MPCWGPLSGYYSATVNPTGKRSIVFDQKKAFSASPVSIPCGRCTGCRLERARQWAVRCMHEARMHPFNSFVTLTYSNEALPENGFLVRRDVTLFLKRLRKARYPERVRYYGCGEYSPTNKRPHYHLILFNCRFPDMKFFSKGKRDGEMLYTSDELRSLWPHGHNVIGAVTFDSAGYVAGYVLDKVNGKQREAGHYEVYDADGCIHERPPELSFISRGSAIGKSYYEKFGSEVLAHDSVVVNGRYARPPRSYDLLSEAGEPPPESGLTDTRQFTRNKRRRRALAVLAKADNTSRRRRVKEELLELRLKAKGKKL